MRGFIYLRRKAGCLIFFTKLAAAFFCLYLSVCLPPCRSVAAAELQLRAVGTSYESYVFVEPTLRMPLNSAGISRELQSSVKRAEQYLAGTRSGLQRLLDHLGSLSDRTRGEPLVTESTATVIWGSALGQ